MQYISEGLSSYHDLLDSRGQTLMRHIGAPKDRQDKVVIRSLKRAPSATEALRLSRRGCFVANETSAPAAADHLVACTGKSNDVFPASHSLVKGNVIVDVPLLIYPWEGG